MALFGLVVAGVDLGTELHLLDLDTLLVLAGGLLLDGLLVLVLAVIHHLADGRIGIGGDLNEVEVLVVCDALSVANTKKTELGAVDADQTAGTGIDLAIDAGSIVLGYVGAPSSLRG